MTGRAPTRGATGSRTPGLPIMGGCEHCGATFAYDVYPSRSGYIRCRLHHRFVTRTSASARDRAIVVVLLYTGLRLAELVALDVDDVKVSARKGIVVVRSGKGDAHREVPLNALVRQVLEEWLAERKTTHERYGPGRRGSGPSVHLRVLSRIGVSAGPTIVGRRQTLR